MTRFDWGTLALAAQRGETPLIQFGCSVGAVAVHDKQPVYLATPYTQRVLDGQGNWSHGLSTALMLDAGREVARLKDVGVIAISPIVLGATLLHAGAYDDGHMRRHNPLDAKAWARWCQPILNVCGAIVVPNLYGWWLSDGIKAEVQHFVDRKLPVFLYAPGFEIDF